MYGVLYLPEALYIQGFVNIHWKDCKVFASVKADLDYFRLWNDTFAYCRPLAGGEVSKALSIVTFETTAVAKKFIKMLCGSEVDRRIDILCISNVYEGNYNRYDHARESSLPREKRSINFSRTLIVPGQFDIVEVECIRSQNTTV